MTELVNETFPCDGTHFYIPGPAGKIESMVNTVNDDHVNIIAVICHPHPLHGGSMQNKVVHTLDKSLHKLGAMTLRFNFRGVGKSEGVYADAVGEVDDLAAVITWLRQHKPDHQLWLAGFSFGAYIVMQAMQAHQPSRLVLVAPPVNIFDFSEIQSPECPCLLVQGVDDEIVDSQQVLAWARQFPTINVVQLAASGHFFHGKLNVLQAAIIDNLSV